METACERSASRFANQSRRPTSSDTGTSTLARETSAGFEVSTTHVVSGAIMGVGSTRRLSAVRWGVATNIVAAWLITIPASALVAAVVYAILHWVFGISV